MALELVVEDLRGDAFSLRLLVAGAQDADGIPTPSSLQSAFSKTCGLLAISALAVLSIRRMER